MSIDKQCYCANLSKYAMPENMGGLSQAVLLFMSSCHEPVPLVKSWTTQSSIISSYTPDLESKPLRPVILFF